MSHLQTPALRKIARCALAALSLVAFTAQAADNELNVYNWSDYIGPDTVANFEKETGIKVRYDTYDSNEALHAKLVAGKTGYDIAVPSFHWAAMQGSAGLLLKIDKSKIANYKNLDPQMMAQIATMDAGNQFTVPWASVVTTVGINVERLKAALGDLPMPDNVWDLVFKPEYMRRAKSCGVSFLDSADEIFPAALHYLGKAPFSTNAADYKLAADMLKEVRPYITLFSSSGYINDLASGSLCLALGWNGDMAIAAARAKEAKNGVNVKVLFPKPGAVIGFDTMVIPSDAAHVENAYKWINYVLRPDVQAGIFNKVKYRGPVRAADALIDKSVTSNEAVFLTPDEANRVVLPTAIGNDTRRVRTRYYTAFKTGL